MIIVVLSVRAVWVSVTGVVKRESFLIRSSISEDLVDELIIPGLAISLKDDYLADVFRYFFLEINFSILLLRNHELVLKEKEPLQPNAERKGWVNREQTCIKMTAIWLGY